MEYKTEFGEPTKFGSLRPGQVFRMACAHESVWLCCDNGVCANLSNGYTYKPGTDCLVCRVKPNGLPVFVDA